MAATTTITSRDNPRLKKLRLLATDAREIYRQRQTLIDGAHLVASHLAKLGPPRLIAVSDSGRRSDEIAGLLAACASETLCLSDDLFRQLSGVQSPAGILALIDIPPPSPVPSGGSCVLLDAVQDPGNVGAMLRSALAAGVRDVRLGPGCAGAWTPRVLRAAQGAHFALNIFEQQDLAEQLRTFPGTTLVTVARGGRSLFDLDLTGQLAWLFGNEGGGVDPELVSLARQAVTIPLHADSESLNVAAAAAVCMFEEVRQKSFKGES